MCRVPTRTRAPYPIVAHVVVDTYDAITYNQSEAAPSPLLSLTTHQVHPGQCSVLILFDSSLKCKLAHEEERLER